LAGHGRAPTSASDKAPGAGGRREGRDVVRLILALLASTVSGWALGETARPPYKASDWPDTPAIVSGRASFYGKRFTGQKTASGKHFHHRDVSAASNRFPSGTTVAVRRPSSAYCIVVRINDRMGHKGRVIDLSREAAERLGMIDVGVTDVEIVLLPKPLLGHERACTLAFSPPVRLPAAEGRLSDSTDDGQPTDSLAGGVGVR